MRLFCPRCGASIAAGELNAARGLGKCVACGNLFSVFNRTRPDDLPAPHAATFPAARPPGMRVQQVGSTLRITWRWFDLSLIPMTFFCVCWDAFLVFWYSKAFSTDAPWIMAVFPLGHLAVGVGLSYRVLAGYLNRTLVECDGRTLRVAHGPLPWRGNRRIPLARISRLQYETADEASSGKEGAHPIELRCVTDDGVIQKLLVTPSRDEARYLKEQLETRLMHR